MSRVIDIWSPSLGNINLTAALLAEIMGEEGGLVETAISTAGDGVLTAAGLIGGLIARTGPTAAYTDTTATAAALQVALQGATFQADVSFMFRIKNATAYAETIAAGAGVTLPATVIVPPFSVGTYFGTLGGTQASPTVTLHHVQTGPLKVANAAVNPQSASVSNTAAQTLSAAAIVGGAIARTTQSAARTDTTDTAVAIIAATSGLGTIGQSFEFTYVNNGLFPITLAGGVGVTLSILTVVPANSWARFLITRNATATVTMVGIAQGYFPKLGTTDAANGATPVSVVDTRVTASSIITLTINTVGGTAHGGFVSAKSAGVGFTINSLAGDTSTYDYEIKG